CAAGEDRAVEHDHRSGANPSAAAPRPRGTFGAAARYGAGAKTTHPATPSGSTTASTVALAARTGAADLLMVPTVARRHTPRSARADAGQVGEVLGVELGRWATLQQVAHEVRLHRPVHHRAGVRRVAGVLRVGATGVQDEIDETEQVACLVRHDRGLDAL